MLKAIHKRFFVLSVLSEYDVLFPLTQNISLSILLQRILTPRRHLWPCFNIWRFRRPLASLTWRDPTASSNWRQRKASVRGRG